MLRIPESQLQLENYNCPLCSGNNIEPISWPAHHDQGLRKGICKACGFVFHNQWMNMETFFTWAKHYHKSPPNLSYYQNEMVKFAFFDELIATYCFIPGPIIWDLSAGMGIFSSKYSHFANRSFEFSQAHAKHGSLYGLKIETNLDLFFQQETQKRPTVIIGHKLLSHIPNPKLFLDRCRSAIDEKAGSKLFITTFLTDHPTYETIRLGFPDEYFSMFTDRSLTNLLAASGFQVTERRFNAPFALFICEPCEKPLEPQKYDVAKEKKTWEFFKKGHEAFFKNDVDGLLKYLPQTVEAHIAKLRETQSDLPLLIAGVENLLQNFPQNIAAMEVSADFYHKAGDLARARMLLESILEDYCSYNILTLYGHVLVDCGEFEKAPQYFLKALEYNPAPIVGTKTGPEAIQEHYNWIQSCLDKVKL